MGLRGRGSWPGRRHISKSSRSLCRSKDLGPVPEWNGLPVHRGRGPSLFDVVIPWSVSWPRETKTKIPRKVVPDLGCLTDSEENNFGKDVWNILISLFVPPLFVFIWFDRRDSHKQYSSRTGDWTKGYHQTPDNGVLVRLGRHSDIEGTWRHIYFWVCDVL